MNTQYYFITNIKMKKTVVIGINIGHDGGVAIIVDGTIKCSISEERLNRQKYSSGYINSFFYCLNYLNLKVSDISLIVFSSYGDSLPLNYQGILNSLNISKNKFLSVNHHLSHAYGAFCLSPFKEAIVLVIDGQGNDKETESYYIANCNKIEKFGGNSSKRNPAKGIGRTYEAFTNFLGWKDQEAGKTMALASYGNHSSYKTPLFRIVNQEIRSELNHKYEFGVIDFMEKYNMNFGKPYSKGSDKYSIDMASYLQNETEKVICDIVDTLVKSTNIYNLCYSGGVGLNCCVNTKIKNNTIINDLFVLPASSDKGQAIGNALYGFHMLTGELLKSPIDNDYFGKNYSEEEISLILNEKKFYSFKKIIPTKNYNYEKQKSIVKTTSKLLAEDKIIAWFQGGSELGPRALGNRSIICNPQNPMMKKILNERIKHREWFRPFAPSCLLNEANKYFNFNDKSPFMLYAVPIIEDKLDMIPAVAHIDGTARLQTVTEKNELFYDLIKEFYKITNIPMVLNTSFNDREPIVESPSDALYTFLSSEIDYLVIGDYLIWKDN